MALWTAAASRGGRAMCLSIPAALPRPISSRFTQGANPGDEGGKREPDADGRTRPGNMAGFVAEKAKKGTRKAAEMVFEKGESTAEGKKESWGYVKETSQKIKDDLLGDEHDKTHHPND